MHFARLVKFSLFLWVMLFLFLALIAGCTTVKTQIAPQVSKAVTLYCAEPLDERKLIRAQVNGLLAANTTIKVTCPGDPIESP